jgi:tripartite ATP-independent transporter DctM subunit
MLIITADVFLRNIFNAPIFGSYETVEFILLSLIFLNMAYTQTLNEHLRIDVIIKKISKENKALVETLTYLICFMIFAMIAGSSFMEGMRSQSGGETSALLEIPVSPFYWVVTYGSVLLVLAYLVNFIDAVTSVLRFFQNKALIYLACAAVVFFLIASLAWWPVASPETIGPARMGIIGLIVMLLLIFYGMPIGPALAAVGFLGFAGLGSIEGGLGILGTSPYTTTLSYTMCTVPLFILMGMFCFKAELSTDIYNTLRTWLGKLPGGLAIATVGGCAGFAAVSGSSLATAATMGTVALPEMKKHKYADSLATGCIAAGGSIGILIPPSIAFIIYAQLAEESIGELFFAGMIPGLLEAVLYILVIYLMCKINPTLGPKAPSTTLREKLISLKGTVGIIVLFCIVIGGIYLGIFTPSEAAGIGASGALLFGLVRGKLNRQKIWESISATCKTTSMLFLMIIGGNIFSTFLAMTQIPFEMANFVTGLQVPNILTLILILLVYVVLGCVMPIFLIIILTVPVFLPVVTSLGYSPIWFGVLMVMMGEMGQITPPFGINTFVIQSVAQDVPLTTIYKGVVPFIITDIFRVALILLFPALALYLPSLLK